MYLHNCVYIYISCLVFIVQALTSLGLDDIECQLSKILLLLLLYIFFLNRYMERAADHVLKQCSSQLWNKQMADIFQNVLNVHFFYLIL